MSLFLASLSCVYSSDRIYGTVATVINFILFLTVNGSLHTAKIFPAVTRYSS